MLLSKLEIENYRSIKKLCLSCGELVTLLGPNNHGKSNVLSAVEFGLSTSVKPTEEDFFTFRRSEEEHPQVASELWVEMTFSELTEQEKNTFGRYLLNGDTIRVRKTAQIKDGKPEIAYNGYVREPEEEWLQASNAGNYTSREKINETQLKGFVPESGRLSKTDIEKAQKEYIEQNQDKLSFSTKLDTNPFMGAKNVASGLLPEFFLIPAVRDLTEEIKIRATTTFGRLMNRAVREMAERDERFKDAREKLESVVTTLNIRGEETDNELAKLEKNIQDELKAWDVRVNIEVSPPEMEKLFELGTDIHLDDGVRTKADRKGNGLQRAMMFALLRAWANALRSREEDSGENPAPRKQSDSVIFAMEEPELFLHPHAQRRLSDSLREIAVTPQHQVFLSTHSTHFVDLNHYKQIAIISKEDAAEGSQLRQCTEELFESESLGDRKKKFHMAQWINPDRGEMFFAHRVVFVEGETEKVLIPYIADKLGLFEPEVSVIDCGSKHNLPLYITIAKAFDIPYVVVHDEDPLPDPIPTEWDINKVKGKQDTFALNEEIKKLVEEPLGKVFMFANDLEQACGVPKNQGKKKGKALAALDFFDSLEAVAMPEALQNVVNICYREEKGTQSIKQAVA